MFMSSEGRRHVCVATVPTGPSERSPSDSTGCRVPGVCMVGNGVRSRQGSEGFRVYRV